jgi:hypothetical protein
MTTLTTRHQVQGNQTIRDQTRIPFWISGLGILTGLVLVVRHRVSRPKTFETVKSTQFPLPYRVAVSAEIRCIANTIRLLARRRIHMPAEHIGKRLSFADGTSARVYRETIVDRGETKDPCVLVVCFRLRAIHGRGHDLFRAESLLNTPLFVGFPGYVSKLWLDHDEHGIYRGVYEWDGPGRAEYYARSLWRVLAVGSVQNSIRYKVLPELRRDEMLDAPHRLDATALPDAGAWWRLVEAV